MTKVVGQLLKNAKLDGYFTNHSLRRTVTTRLFQTGVDQKIMKEFTGHVSDAIDKYQIMSNDQKEQLSKIVSGQMGQKNVENVPKVETSKVEPSLEVSV